MNKGCTGTSKLGPGRLRTTICSAMHDIIKQPICMPFTGSSHTRARVSACCAYRPAARTGLSGFITAIKREDQTRSLGAISEDARGYQQGRSGLSHHWKPVDQGAFWLLSPTSVGVFLSVETLC